ncbi:MAG: TonB-dependent receptor, partial [Ferruginibacter sp.]|nr:TonB-dependent receptor [Ferruginibacter sp.]
MRFTIALFLCIFFLHSNAQNKYATISGQVLDENESPLGNVSITILGKSTGKTSEESGKFTIKVPAEKPIALIFSYTGFNPQQKNFFLSKNETENIVVRMMKAGKTLETVIISDERERTENGLIKINPKNAILLPSVTGGIEGLIKTMVGSNNELSSQYSVRGGNFDENLVYINDFEIYRPYLVSNGQQEGLSFINPDLVRNVQFYTGGFQSKYGDKMSSVLDIQYKKPARFGGTAYISLLEQGLQLEGTLHKNKVSFVAGVRNKNNRNVLSNQPTLGSYIPSASDFQSLISYKPNEHWQFDILSIVSQCRFTFYPESVKKTSSVFSPFFTANLGLDTYFEGLEKDSYFTSMIGATINHAPNQKLRLKWMLSRFKDIENENFDIKGAYLFGARDFDRTSNTFGEIVNPLGAGHYQQFARNKLDIESWTAAHKGSYSFQNHFFQWGNSIEQTKIADVLNQFEYQDSAGYSLPYNSNALFSSLKSSARLSIFKFSGYIQDNIHVTGKKGDLTLQTGVRYNYNQLNKECLISPRMQASWKPVWKKDIIFRFASGMYN